MKLHNLLERVSRMEDSRCSIWNQTYFVESFAALVISPWHCDLQSIDTTLGAGMIIECHLLPHNIQYLLKFCVLLLPD